jgi:hypothetical protein
MLPLPELLQWVKLLTNIDEDRSADAIAELRTWGLQALEDELLGEPDLDTVVAAVLLVESVDSLVTQGVERTKLLKKLRDAKRSEAIWPVWAEIRAAGVLIGHPEIDVRLEMESGRSGGRHADYRLEYPDGSRVEVEFKAIGLSDAEVEWHRLAAGHFDRLLPPIGLTTLHGFVGEPIRVSRDKRKRSWVGARRLASQLPPVAAQWGRVRGISIVGHQTEDEYLRRALSRVERALGQLSTDEECWVGLWWSNGAPIRAMNRLLETLRAPANVAGVSFIGQAVSVPWSEINCYITNVERGVDVSEFSVSSTVDDHLAKLVLDRFESSSGNRPALLRSPGPKGGTLLRRDGARRIHPFNLLFDADPRELAGPIRPPSPVQDVPLNR